MTFYIEDNRGGSGQKELSLVIDDCSVNGGTEFDVVVYADECCFLKEG